MSRRFQTTAEPAWPAALAILFIVLLQVSLGEKLTLGPNWLLPALELGILIPLMAVSPVRLPDEARNRRVATIVLIGLVNAANIVSLGLLVYYMLKGGKTTGVALLLDALKLWLTNVVIFALWYWELDSGGPGGRSVKRREHPDFLFPQMTSPPFAPKGWRSGFVDYLFISFTNATAFSPTDTLPLSGWAKLLMMIQALTSLLAVAFVAARAVNILQ